MVCFGSWHVSVQEQFLPRLGARLSLRVKTRVPPLPSLLMVDKRVVCMRGRVGKERSARDWKCRGFVRRRGRMSLVAAVYECNCCPRSAFYTITPFTTPKKWPSVTIRSTQTQCRSRDKLHCTLSDLTSSLSAQSTAHTR